MWPSHKLALGLNNCFLLKPLSMVCPVHSNLAGYSPNTVPKFNHPAPQKKIYSFANPQPIRTPFNIYYNPIRRPFLSHSHQFSPYSPIRRPKIIFIIFCPHLAAPLKNIIFAGRYNFGTVHGHIRCIYTILA